MTIKHLSVITNYRCALKYGHQVCTVELESITMLFPWIRFGQGSPGSFSLSLSLSLSSSFKIGQRYRRRGEREGGEGFACFACWLRQFVLAATNAAVTAVRLGPTGPPTLSVSPSAGSSAALSSVDRASHARLLGDSRGRAFSSLISLLGSLHDSSHFRSCVREEMYLRA